MAQYLFEEETYKIIGILFEVHKNLGKGFSEIVYKDALEFEFNENNVPYEREKEYFDQFKEYLSKFGYIQPDLNKLVSVCEILKFNKGKIIIKSGVNQNHIFFICKGLVRKFVITEHGEISLLGGEYSLILNQKSRLSV